MAVTQYTTPTFTLTFTEEGLDLTQARNVYVTFKGQGVNITKTGNDLTIEEKQIQVLMNQDETGQMHDQIDIQVNWTLPNGIRAASDIVTVEIECNLLKRVVE